MARFVISTPTVSDAIGKQFLRLSEHLSQTGHDVHLVEFREPGGLMPSHPASERLTVSRWPSSKGTTASDAAFFIRLLRSVRPDCVVGQLESTNWTMLLSKLVGIPVRVAWSHMLMRTFDIEGAALVVAAAHPSPLNRLSVRHERRIGLVRRDRRSDEVLPRRPSQVSRSSLRAGGSARSVARR